MIETKIKGRIGRPYLITNNIGLVGESFVMDGHFGHSELQAYVEDYQELKSKVKERIEAESEDDWAAGSDTQEEIWDVAQDQFFKSIEYDSLNDYAKLAEAAYLEVEEKTTHEDWWDVQDRINEFTLTDMASYLPAYYTKDAAHEIVFHAISIDLTVSD